MLQIRFSSYLPPNLKPCFAYDAFLQYVILLFPVVIYFLNIIIVIQEIKNSPIFVISASSVSVTYVCGIMVTSADAIGMFCSSSALCTASKSSGAVVISKLSSASEKFFCTCIKCKHHQIITIHITFFFVNDNLSFLHRTYRIHIPVYRYFPVPW